MNDTRWIHNVTFTSLHPDFSGREASGFCFSSSDWLLMLTGLLGEVRGVLAGKWKNIKLIQYFPLTHIRCMFNFFRKLILCDEMEASKIKLF